MERNYKMALPSDTVNRIRNILNDVGLMSYEKYWKTLNGQTFSCGVNLEGNDYIMTLGKGMDQRYCLASAYGELMERVQNLIIFAGRVGSSINKVVGLFSDTKEIKDRKSVV